jgi:hypothetical protein
VPTILLLQLPRSSLYLLRPPAFCFRFHFTFLVLFAAKMSFLGRGAPSPAGGVNQERVEMAINECVGSNLIQAIAVDPAP